MEFVKNTFKMWNIYHFAGWAEGQGIEEAFQNFIAKGLMKIVVQEQFFKISEKAIKNYTKFGLK